MATKFIGGGILSSVEPSRAQRCFLSDLHKGVAGFLLTGDVAYFVYLGRVVVPLTPKYVEFYVHTAGVGAQTAEVGFFSTPLAPNKANQVLTKLVSTGTIGDLTGTGIIRNTAAFATAIAIGTHLWAGIRTDMATTEPTITGLINSMSHGQILSTAAAGALTGAGPWTGVVIAAALTEACPDLRGTLD